MSALPKPFIGWKACEQRFYLDALPITEEEAMKHWETVLKRHRDPSVETTAIFLPGAAARIAKIARYKNQA